MVTDKCDEIEAGRLPAVSQDLGRRENVKILL
jgi:hypothetical protein